MFCAHVQVYMSFSSIKSQFPHPSDALYMYANSNKMITFQLETLDHTIRIGSTPTFLYFDLYLHSAYAAHYV